MAIIDLLNVAVAVDWLDLAVLELLRIIIVSFIASPILWLVGRAVVGGRKAKFTDAFWIIFLGTVISALISTGGSALNLTGFTALILGTIIQLLIWLGLVKHFFDTDWLRAFGISILAVIVAIVVAVVLVWILVGFGMLLGWSWI
ncbi:MAG: hypothetical protein ACE5L6_08650 [Candidatus Bathyarchaeia archaeon]